MEHEFVTVSRETLEETGTHRVWGRLLVSQPTRFDEFSFDLITESELSDDEVVVQAMLRAGIPVEA